MAIVRAPEASSSTFRYNYQVFLSFRGEDTRKAFTDHLYAALVQAGLRTFRDDDEIERGKRLELELRRAIQQSRISIIVLSKNYASSKWCLDEVVMILEWSKIGGNEVLPVFYDVDPSDVRKQTGSIGQAFARYEEEFIKAEIDHEMKKEWMEKVKGWKVALKEVANLTGMVLQNQADGHEAKFIQEIVKVVERKLNRAVLYAGRHLVGMHSRAKDIDSWVQDSSSSEDILVICGMGGIGKTTIAKYVFNLNFQRFEGSSFLASVKDKSQQPNGLVNLQRQLLSNILQGKRKQIYNVDEGIIKINEAISCKSVLVVIDDADEVKQLDALLGTTREFHPGSKIIVTTRNLSLLKPHEVHKLHIVEELDSYESLKLFCWHAFGKEHPIEGYKEQLKRAVDHCGGLPLAHEILGSSLAGKNTKVWASTLEKLEAIPETKILNVLKISFDSLEDNHDKNLFLHIACFFVGHKKDKTIEILDACDYITVCGIQNLVDRCLLSIDENSKLMMHQFIQEMGRQIVDQESPKEPGRRSRLWRHRDSFKVLKGKGGTETIEGLMLDMRMYKDNTFNGKNAKNVLNEEFCDTPWSSNQGSSFKQRYFSFLSSETLDAASDVELKFDSFSRMDKLRLLKLNYVKLSGCCKNFPENIIWLCWHGFPLKSIPFDLPLGNLVSLDMRYSKLEHVWPGNKVLLSLKILNLSHSEWLVKTPNFTGLPNLERLILKGCVRLVEVCDTIGNLERLTLLNLKNCKSLRKFPMDLKNMESLKVLNANGIAVNRLPSTRGDVKLWHKFRPWVMKNPEQIYVSLPRSLVRLSLRKCNLSDDAFPLDFSNLSLLQILDLSKNHFRNLPGCIGSLNKLKALNLTSCKQLHSISGLPNVNILAVEECTSLESVTYQSALNKPFIILDGCGKLREIQGIVKFEPIEEVDIEILFDDDADGSTFVRQIIFDDDCLSSSSSISFVVPSHPNLRLRGSNLNFRYTISTTDEDMLERMLLQGPCPFIITKISNKTKDLHWIYNPVFFQVDDDDVDDLVWFSQWKFGNHQLESGDVVNVSVIAAHFFKLRECWLDQLVWGEEEEEIKAAATTHHHNNTRELVEIYHPLYLKGYKRVAVAMVGPSFLDGAD